MGKQVRSEPAVDREKDPDVVARRTELFNKYVMPFKNMIYKLCIMYTSNPDDVAENYSEVLVNFYRRIETYNPERPIRAWLHTCTKRQVWACDKQRQVHNNRDRDKSIEEFEDYLLDDGKVSSNSLGEDNWRLQYNEYIVALLDQLKPCYRDALILQESGYSLREIAEIEYAKGSLKTLNLETIKSRLRLARQHLKNNLTRDGQRLPNPKDD